MTSSEAKSVAEELPYRDYVATKDFGALNGVRGLCCLAVVRDHTGLQIAGLKLLDYSYLAVDMFFTISGFLIVTLLIRERERRGTINLPNFYARRTLRIFPVYYGLIFAFLLFSLAISPWRPNTWNFYKWTFPVLLTYTQDVILTNIGYFAHTWSLAIEEQFYLIWPMAERFLSHNLRWLALSGVILISQAVNFGFFNPLLAEIYGSAAFRLPLYQITLMPITLGVVLAYLLHNERTFAMLYAIVGWRWAFLPLLLALLLLLELSPVDLAGWPRLGVHLIFMLLLGSLVIRRDHHAMPFLAFAPLARIGVLSYGIYVYQFILIQTLKSLPVNMPPGMLFVAAVLLAIGFAEISFRYYESPILRLRQRFRN